MSHDAWCHVNHDRAGLVSNQSRYAAYDKTRPLVIVAVCATEKCIAKGIKNVAGRTNETAAFELDGGTQ